jgi:hypothetical protein
MGPLFSFAKINIAALNQSNVQKGANIALFSHAGPQTLAQVAGNEATIVQG